MKRLVKRIFDEIEQAIERTRSPVPVPLRESKFLEEFAKIKKRYIKEKDGT